METQIANPRITGKSRIKFWSTVFLIFLSTFSLFAQNDNRVPFTHRVGNPAPDDNIFRLRGDFTMIGNTNLTLSNYSESSNNSSNQMVYVDIDNNPSTINSSSSTLVFSQENNADPNCSEIVYAGLYWSGRATPGVGNTFDVVIGTEYGQTQTITNSTQNLNHNQDINLSSYSLSISRKGNQNSRYPRFSFSSSSGLNTYQFEFTNDNNNPGRYRIGTNGDWTTLSNQNVTTSGSTSQLTFDPITIVEDDMTFTIGTIQRNSSNNGNTESYQNNNNWIRVTSNGTFTPETDIFKTLDKRKVKLKGPAASDYTELTANANHILYPSGELGDMYVGYVDVTQYIKTNGLGEYSVADMALTEGNGGSTGYYGHWGIVVVYGNSKMSWRDVTIFDGFSFVQSPGNSEVATGELLIDGFNAVQNGDVNLKLGVMAGEGDRGISGDFLEIQNADQTDWVRLSHPLNSTGNFFNSSIYTPTLTNAGKLVNNPRNPNLLNNTGIDIAMWNVPNENNSIFANSQTATTFRYGTNQDLYNIYAIAFAVDAYIPDVQGLNKVVAINGIAANSSPTALPGQLIDYSLEIRNLGSEGIENTRIVIPIPYTASFVSASSESFFNPNTISQPYFDPALGATGSIVWELGEIPVAENIMDILAKLSYRLKTTEDCFLLANEECVAYVAVLGTISGKGKISQSEFDTVQLTHGFLDGDCQGEPIQSALVIPIIGAAEFVNQNCRAEDIFKEFFFCNVDQSQGVSVNSVKNSFPIGTRFYNGPDPETAIEFTQNNPFPANDGIYYAIPPNSSDCVFQFRIIVTIVISNPSLPDADELAFCIGEQIPNLASVITPSNLGETNAYNVYFFNSETGGVAQTDFQVSSDNHGTVQLWVAEGYSPNCIGPRVPVTVTINPIPAAPVGVDQSVCFSDGISITATANIGEGMAFRWFDQAIGGNLVLDPTLSIPGTVTYYAEAFNPLTECVGLERTAVTLNILDCEISLEKSGSYFDVDENGIVNIGDKIIYTFTVSNNGNVPISNISIIDPKVTIIGGSIGLMGAGESDDDTFSAEYLVTQLDIDSGTFTNTATASGTALGEDISSSDDDTQTFIRSPALSITKTATESTFSAVGDVLNYTIVVTNTGNVTLSNVAVSDPLTGLNTSIPSLAPLASQSIPTSYTITQADIDAGKVDNTASAAVGTVNVSASESVTATQSPALSITKTATESTFSAVGNVLNYTIVVTNTGNVTLSNIALSDPLTGLNTSIPSLAPLASQSIPTSYTITQADIDAGKVDNTASAAVGTVNVSASESVTATQSPALSISKTAPENTFASVGDVLNYTIVVTNTGNVTLSNVAVSDPLTGLNTTIASLAPLASESIPTSYTVTQADLDRGFVTNKATVSGVSASDEPVEESDEVTVVASENPSIEVSKTADTTTFSEIGQVITYTITVKNKGNITLTNLLVNDPLTGLTQVIPSIAPGQTMAISTEYVVKLEDLNAGSIINNVSVTAKSRDGNDVGGTDSVTIGASSTQIDGIDDNMGEYPVDYGGVLGNLLTNDLLNHKPVNFTDVNFEFTELAGIVGLLIEENGELSLIPGLNEPGEYRLKYTLRKALDPNNSDEVFVVFKLLENDVDLKVTKTSNGIEIFEGDEFEYEIRVTNIGGTDAKNVTIVDDLPNGLSYIRTTISESNPGVEVDMTVNGSKISYTIISFPAGSSLLLKIKVRAEEFDSDKPLQITNIVSVSAYEEDTNMDDNSDSDINQIIPFFIPTVITPNGDGLNDRFEILGLGKFASNDIVIFNRNGDHVFERKNYGNDWSAEGLAAGTYFFLLKSIDRQGKLHEFQGWIQVIKK